MKSNMLKLLTGLIGLSMSLSAVFGQWVVDPGSLTPSPNPNHRCVMWGECHMVGAHMRNCRYDGPPVSVFHDFSSSEMHQEVLDIMESRCPQFLHDDEGNRLPDDQVFTCCSQDQFLSMASNFQLADGVLGRCPACLRNFVRQVCEMNCSPTQVDFLTVETAFTPTGLEYIEEVNYRMHEDFMMDAHVSCSGVIIPQTGLPAINMMCGNAPVCDAEAWFGFSGDTSNNPFAPVQVNFLKWPNPEESMSVRALRCNETFGEDLACSCVDCFDNCPTGVEPSVPDMCTVLSVNCVGFSVGITFFVITVIIFSILTIIDYRKMRSVSDFKDDTYKAKDVNKLTQFFELIFSKIGGFCATNPVLILMLTSWLYFGMLYGAININLTTEPLELWSSPSSRTRQELNYFNTRFGPFYRTSQVYLQVTGLDNFTQNDIDYGPAFRLEVIEELITLEDAIINIGRGANSVTLEEVCYAPMLRPGQERNLDQCVITSVATYFGDDRHNIDSASYLSRIQNCINNHLSFGCIAEWGGGAEPEMAFGGFVGDNILSADTLVINLPLANYVLDENLISVLEWERMFIDLLHDYQNNWKSDYITVAFGSERSIEDELIRVSQAEIIPISISYILMLVYVIFSLGQIKSWRTFFVNSKMVVGVASILVVLLAIFCAMGLLGYLGITSTLLAINVIPFFVLSVGIDNVFLMVHSIEDVVNNLENYKDYNPNMTFSEKKRFVFEKMMKKSGPSIFITSITQIICFAIGTISNFPAVITFAIFATFSLCFLFIFQITTIVSILAIDFKRVEQNRFDILCCIQRKVLDDTDPLRSGAPHKSVTQRIIEPYSNFIIDWRFKILVAILFMALTSVSIILLPQLDVGLDQELALPKDSYVYSYLQAVNNLLSIGPPVYFILTPGLNFTDPVHQNAICGGQMCNSDSLATQLFLASRYSNITYLSQPSNSWIDDFFDWSTLHRACCRYNVEDGSFCTSTNTSSVCQFCSIELEENGLRPVTDDFQHYIQFFLQDPPTDECNKGGLASYSAGVNYLLDSNGQATVQETNFMSFHTPLATSYDYIQAVKNAQEISANITAAIRSSTGVADVEVFPYAVFYVFYEQYLTMWTDTFASLGYSLLATLLFTFVLSGFNFITTFAILFTVILVVIDMMGLMYIWNIPLNAVSCVNLIVSIGIAVEFCSHTVYAYSTSTESPRNKTKDALRRVGATIITGITMTNIPIVVLAFSYTELIEIFFFRMFFGLVIIGFLHGMVFLPVLLSFLTNVTSYSS